MALNTPVDIKTLASAIHKKYGTQEEAFDIVDLLDIKWPQFDSRFSLVVRSDISMDGQFAKTKPELKQIIVSRSTYLGARAGYPVERHVLAHEFGHLLIKHVKTYGKLKGGYTTLDAEALSTLFADELLLPARYICDTECTRVRQLAEKFLIPEVAVRRQIREINR